MKHLVRQYPLVSFFAAAFVVSWAIWLPGVLAWKHSGSPADVPWWLSLAGLLGSYGPSAAAVIVTGVLGGRRAVGELFGKFRHWRAGLRWYLLIFLAPPAVLAVAMGIHAAQGHSLGRLDWGQWPLVLAMPLLVLPFGSLGEELGWRGFALSALQRRHNALVSSIILGTLWTFWHAPAFWAPSGTILSGSPVTVSAVGLYLLFTIALAILITWVFNNTGGSVPIAVLFHTMMNAGILLPLFPDLSDHAINAIIRLHIYPLWALTGLVILRFGARRLVERSSASPLTARP